MRKLYLKDLQKIYEEQPIFEVFHCQVNGLTFQRGAAYLLRRHPGLCVECDRFAREEKSA